MITCSRPFHDLNRVLSRFFLVNSLALLGICGGIIPQASLRPPALFFSHFAYSQSFSDTQIKQYAQAVVAIEAERKKTYDKLQSVLGKTPPPIVCNQKDSFRGLSREARTLAVNFCNQSKKIAEDSGLTSQVFNAITQAARQDANFKKQIQRAILRLKPNGK
jgi:hypothetical protein